MKIKYCYFKVANYSIIALAYYSIERTITIPVRHAGSTKPMKTSLCKFHSSFFHAIFERSDKSLKFSTTKDVEQFFSAANECKKKIFLSIFFATQLK